MGVFGLSTEAHEYLISLGVPVASKNDSNKDKQSLVIFQWETEKSLLGKYFDYFFDMSNRNHPLLVEVVETLGTKASNGFAQLEVVEIPDNVEFQIEEYDGIEWIAEKHRTWS